MAARQRFDVQPLHNLLLTKLEIPLLGARIVLRERLTGLLNQALKHRVTLLTAPTGYGKTTLLVEWLTTVQARRWRTVWVSIDSLDNSPLRLWSYVVAGVKKIYPRLSYDIPQMLERGYDPYDLTLLNPLFNEIARIQHPICLVLDDYQEIQAEAIHEALGYFIDHLPANLHLVISSRTVPPLPLHRVRARRQLLEIASADLSFTLPEVRSFLTQVMNLEMNSAQTVQLYEMTEGWIAGLQLAALAGRSHNLGEPLQIGGVENNRELLDYLTMEVVNRQSEGVKEFLLKTSILTELSPSLCDAVLGRSDSQEILSQVERSNLFIVRLDEKQAWYRYHPLFADALQIHLRQEYPAQVAGLHSRACAWLLGQNYPEKAVAHAIAAGDLEMAAEIVETYAMKAIIAYDLTSLLQWFSYFDQSLFQRRPRLGIFRALTNQFSGQRARLDEELDWVERILDDAARRGIPLQEEQVLRWEVAVIRAGDCCLDSRYEQGIAGLKALLADKPQENNFFEGYSHYALGVAHDNAGQLEDAVREFDLGVQSATPDHPLEYVQGRGEAGRVLRKLGRLSQAREVYLDAIAFARSAGLSPSILVIPQSGLLELALDRDEIENADELAREVLQNFDFIEKRPAIRTYYLTIAHRMAKYFLAIGDMNKARAYFQQANAFHARIHNPLSVVPAQLLDLRVSVSLADGSLQDMISELTAFSNQGPAQLAARHGLARLFYAEVELAPARQILTELIQDLDKGAYGEMLIRAQALLALVCRAQGMAEEAMAWLDAALQRAEPEDSLRAFLDGGEPMRALIGEYLAAGERAATPQARLFAVTVAERFARRSKTAAPPGLEALPAGPEAGELSFPMEALSRREIEVLKALSSGKSAKEIALDLKISMNTAKVHIRNIYRKLGTHSRKVVFERASELGIHGS